MSLHQINHQSLLQQKRITDLNPSVIILSGGPNSVHVKGAPTVPSDFFAHCEAKKIPVLGICYGMQLIVQKLGGGGLGGEGKEK